MSGRALAATECPEPLSWTPQEMIDRMVAIDSWSGMGTKGSLGGDPSSHVVHVKFFRACMKKQGKQTPNCGITRD